MEGKYCQKFLNRIEAKFKFLFEQYGFVPKELAGEDVHCQIVLGSEICQVQFYIDRGTPEYYFGTLDADLKSKEDWISGDAICDYLFRQNPEIAIPWPKYKRNEGTEDDLGDLDIFASRLEPAAAKIIAAYAANLKVDWWKDFIADREAGIKEMRERRARGEIRL